MGTELELHVDVVRVLKAVLKAENVGMHHRLMDLDLAKELRSSGRQWCEGVDEQRGGVCSLTLDLFFVERSCCLSMTLTAF